MERNKSLFVKNTGGRYMKITAAAPIDIKALLNTGGISNPTVPLSNITSVYVTAAANPHKIPVVKVKLLQSNPDAKADPISKTAMEIIFCFVGVL